MTKPKLLTIVTVCFLAAASFARADDGKFYTPDPITDPDSPHDMGVLIKDLTIKIPAVYESNRYKPSKSAGCSVMDRTFGEGLSELSIRKDDEFRISMLYQQQGANFFVLDFAEACGNNGGAALDVSRRIEGRNELVELHCGGVRIPVISAWGSGKIVLTVDRQSRALKHVSFEQHDGWYRRGFLGSAFDKQALECDL